MRRVPPPWARCRSGRGRGWAGSPRRSLRVRLAWTFVLVALITLLLAFAALGSAAYHRGTMRPWNYHLLFISFAFAIGAGVVTAGRIARGLSRLRDAVERLDLKNLSLRVPVEGDDETADLARAFNRMVDRLEAEERARRQLFADVAHELRHPLAVLQGRLEMMQDGVVPLDGEQVLHLQDMVLALARLVGDLRDLSLAEVGGLSLHLAPVDVAALIGDLLENMEPVAADRGISLGALVEEDLPPVTGDADRLRQVLVNLLANALHYTPRGGRVDVRATADAAGVTVEVADTGPGIAPEDLPHLFDRFYRADKARSRTTGGSGLGLAIVRSLVTLHGGDARVESEVGKGSRFIVRLPRASGQEPGAANA